MELCGQPEVEILDDEGEARYWLCQSFYGHFLGVHAGGGEYNLSRVHLPFVSRSASYRYEGWALMAGFSYGYSWVLGKRWNLEATIGAGGCMLNTNVLIVRSVVNIGERTRKIFWRRPCGHQSDLYVKIKSLMKEKIRIDRLRMCFRKMPPAVCFLTLFALCFGALSVRAADPSGRVALTAVRNAACGWTGICLVCP